MGPWKPWLMTRGDQLIPPPNHPAYVSNAAIIASGAAALVGSMFLQEAAP